MILTLEEALAGKQTKIKDNEYLSSEAYITPFLERMASFTDEFIFQGKLPNQVTVSEDEVDITYNRMWIQAILPDELSFPNHREVIGLVYGLDVRKPVAKIYRGALNNACLNLCVFNPSFLNVQELQPDTPINFKCLKSLMEETSDIVSYLKRLEETEVPYNQDLINENLGMWVRNSLSKSYDNGYGKVKIASSTPIDAYKLLYTDKKSPYFVKEGETTNMFNVYNAMTELITNDGPEGVAKDIINKAEKTLLVKEILAI
jgi:hypothetical protein